MMEELENDFRFYLQPSTNLRQSYTSYPEFLNAPVFSAIYEVLRDEEIWRMNYNQFYNRHCFK